MYSFSLFSNLCVTGPSVRYPLSNTSHTDFLIFSLIKGFINEKCVFECTLLDENWQAKKWGLLEDVNEKQKNEFLIIKEFNRLFKILG